MQIRGGCLSKSNLKRYEYNSGRKGFFLDSSLIKGLYVRKRQMQTTREKPQTRASMRKAQAMPSLKASCGLSA